MEDFLLLEEIEGAFGTSEQKIEAIEASEWALEEPSLSALSSRLARQQKMLTSPLSLWRVQVASKEGAEAFKTLMQASPEIAMTIPLLVAFQGIGGEGWKALAEGVRLHPGFLLREFTVPKDDLDEARREDIRVRWDALETGGEAFVELDPRVFQWVEKTEGEEGWTTMVELIHMSKEELAAELD